MLRPPTSYEKIEAEVKRLLFDYRTAKAQDELGKASLVRDKLAEYIVKNSNSIEHMLHYFNAPMNEGEDNVPF